jgi:NADPH:quinone reductase-like Zn-dependent oxidoreductase
VPQALTVREFGGPEAPVVEDRPELEPAAGEVVIDLRASALNRRDLRVIAGGWPGVTPPLVPGSDGAGVVRSVGSGVSGWSKGDEVLILPSLDWGDDPTLLGPHFRILGGPDDGTFAEQVRVPAENVFAKPSRLSFEEAAALPLAGLTTWRALFTRGRLRSGETVLVQGAGAGTSTFAVEFARAAGARVFVTSGSAEKIARAVELGAEAGFDYNDEGWEQELAGRTGGGVDLVMDSAGTWHASAASVRSGGRIVFFGATTGPTTEVDIRALYFKQVDLLGTMMGSPADFRALLRACEGQDWTPVIDSARPLAEAGDALARMQASEQFGKLVLTP